MRKLFLWILLAALCAGLTACAGTPPESHIEEMPEAETLQTLFTGVTGYRGSSGSALRNAQGACNLLTFAESADYANISLTNREESVSSAYLSMSDEQREEFSANFADILDFMKACLKYSEHFPKKGKSVFQTAFRCNRRIHGKFFKNLNFQG